MTDSVESWFRQLPHDDDTPKPEEEQALIELLTGTVPANVAAEKFTSAVAREETPEDGLERIWSFIDDAAEELGSKHAKLIELLAEIKKLPDLTRDGQPLTADGDNVIWKDLPRFGWDIRDRWGCTCISPSHHILALETLPLRPERTEWHVFPLGASLTLTSRL